MSELLTVAEVAELLKHPEPASDAAARMVRRKVALGMPQVRGMRPPMFVKAHVLAWIDEQSRSVAPPPELPAPTRHRKRTTKLQAQTGSAIDYEITRLRNELVG